MNLTKSERFEKALHSNAPLFPAGLARVYNVFASTSPVPTAGGPDLLNRSLDPLRIPSRRLPSTAPLHGSLRAHSARPQLLSSPSPSWGSLKSEHIQEDSSHKRKNTASKERQKRWAAPTMERVGALVSTRARAARRAIIQALPSTLPLCSDIQLFRHSLQLSNSDTLPTEPTSSPPAGPTKPRPRSLEEALSDGPSEARSYAADCEKRTPRTEQTTTRSRRSQGCPSLFDARALA